jgi:ATP-dependent helicase/nuclease subunit B
MSLRFVFGPSGSGKSTTVYQECLRRAKEHPESNFLIVVPDQFTMATQAALVGLSDAHGILNIDVLSFGRLTHRILEEVGTEDIPVLDDTGKSLVLQKVAGGLEQQMPVLGRRMHSQGYIHEVKSALSEFMQYGIRPEDVDSLIGYASGRGALKAKLQDLQVIYRGFKDYLAGRFITTEEKLDILRQSMPLSHILPGSVVVFDGFTGFTPIQMEVIGDLMHLVDEVICTLAMGEGEEPFRPVEEQDLFALSVKTAQGLVKLAEEVGCERGEDIYCTHSSANPEVWHLERNLFRYGAASYSGEPKSIHLSEMTSPAQEVHMTALEICRLIRTEGYKYRDIAVVCGNLEDYAPYAEREFARLGIPCYIDRTGSIRLNPLAEAVGAILNLYRMDFSADAVIRFLRSGLCDFTPEETDELESYVTQTGIRGRKRWNSIFTRKTLLMEGDESALTRMNVLREKFLEQTRCFEGTGKNTVAHYVDCLYEFLVRNRADETLRKYEAYFHENGNLSREKEFSQIYNLVMQLLEQIRGLMGEEITDLKEFSEIISAGFGEIRVGTIPLNVDRVMVGDMERSRLVGVKCLFFLGVNDGNIPKNSKGGGIISELERELLQEAGAELAPTPRQEMYTQRLYLYLNMTKPTEELYVSYSALNGAGDTLRPSYLIRELTALFPNLKTDYPEQQPVLNHVVTRKEGLRYLAEGLRKYASGEQGFSEEELMTLYRAYEGEYGPLRNELQSAAFSRYLDIPLSAEAVRELYGLSLYGSVSRLEKYSGCPYSFFLQYGLKLEKTREYAVSTVDRGNLFHSVLKEFSENLKTDGYTWRDFPPDYAGRTIPDILSRQAANYGAAVYYDNSRNSYEVLRMQRMLIRSVNNLRFQAGEGQFLPMAFEEPFRREISLGANPAGEEQKVIMTGIIDRIDLAETDDSVFVKILDYKSGARSLKPESILTGDQLQLPLYLEQKVTDLQKQTSKQVVPAAMLYYKVGDPEIREDGAFDSEVMEQKLRKEMRPSGMISQREDVLSLLDAGLGAAAGTYTSEVVCVDRKKDGGLGAYSQTVSPEVMDAILRYSVLEARDIGKEILGGRKSVCPGPGACDYCDFASVCGFEAGFPGYGKRPGSKMEKDEAVEKILEAVHGESGTGSDNGKDNEES